MCEICLKVSLKYVCAQCANDIIIRKQVKQLRIQRRSDVMQLLTSSELLLMPSVLARSINTYLGDMPNYIL
jgi:hypothetical protein